MKDQKGEIILPILTIQVLWPMIRLESLSSIVEYAYIILFMSKDFRVIIYSLDFL